jgi:hypothetical protein
MLERLAYETRPVVYGNADTDERWYHENFYPFKINGL